MPTKTLACADDHSIWLQYYGANGTGGVAGDSYDATPDDLSVSLFNYGSSSILARSLLKFTMNWTGVTQIVSAVLYMRVKVNPNIPMGSTPSTLVRRLSAAFSTTTVWPGPTSNSTHETYSGVVSGTNGAWETIDITDMIEDWAPSTVKKRDGSPGSGITHYGVRLYGTAETNTLHTWNVYSRSGTSDPYILLTYSTNTPPTMSACQVGGASTGATIAGASAPSMTGTWTDAEGDAITAYDIDVDTTTGDGVMPDWVSPTFSVVQAAPHASIVGSAITRTLTGVTTRGQWYCARIRASDVTSGYGPYVYVYFKLNSLITVTLSQPAASSKLAKMEYVAGSGWATPRFRVTWNLDPRQTMYEIDIKTDNAGNPTGTTMVSGQVASTTVHDLIPTLLATPAENTRYHIRVRVFDGIEWSAYSGYFIVRCRWGLSTHRKDISIGGLAPTTLAVTTLTTTVDPTKNSLVIEYNSSDDGTTNLAATWLDNIASVVKRKWVHYRIWLTGWGNSPGTSASLDKIVFQASGNVLQPDQWLPNPTSGVGASIEVGDRVFGTQCLRIDGNGTSRVVYQLLSIMPNTDYILQARMRSVGNSGAYVGLSDTATAAGMLIQTPIRTATSPWPEQSEVSAVWNSGSRSVVYVICVVTGAGGTTGYFDGLKVEPGQVTSPWSSGTVALPAVLDSAGVQVDATEGGILRLRGSTGGTRDRVDLGAQGMKFGGDTEVLSPSTGALQVGSKAVLLAGDTVLIPTGTSFPGSPATGALFWRSDLAMEFYYDGTRWLSTQTFEAALSMGLRVLTPVAASIGFAARWPVSLKGGSDLWLVDVTTEFNIVNGTALSASHKWVATFLSRGLNTVTDTTFATTNIVSGSVNLDRQDVQTIGALLNAGTPQALIAANWTKTGTPGDIYFASVVNYRVVG